MPATLPSPQPTVIEILSDLVTSRAAEIDGWIAKAYQGKTPPFYSSLDIRHAGFKLAPVDSNLFPAGFNNLTAEECKVAAERIRTFLQAHHPQVKNILLYPELHTRNQYYASNVWVIQELLMQAGYAVVIATAEPTYCVETADHKWLEVMQVTQKEGKLCLANCEKFCPELVILNNDLSGSVPPVLEGLSIPVMPPVQLGWHTRRKSAHFTAYNLLAYEFAADFGFDPWLISTFSGACGEVNFKEKTGLECVAENVSAMLPKIQKKYAEYGITEQPYIYIKSDYGTYGMGIMLVKSPEEVFEINKKERNKMSMVKGNTENHEVMLQEGVPTIDRISDSTAESVVYCIGGAPVGLFFRTNNQKDAYSNLNSPAGMGFAHDAPILTPEYHAACGLVSRLVNVAVTREVY